MAVLGLGILVATVSFTLLTSAVRTGALEVRGAVARNFRPAYDVLVRPPSSYTSLEKRRGLVPDNYLSGIFGGISLEQLHSVERIPGVSVAAPVANLGYILLFEYVDVPVNRFLDGAPDQLYRLRLSYPVQHGAWSYPGTSAFVYYTTAHSFKRSLHAPGGVTETVGKKGMNRSIAPCAAFPRVAPEARTPFASESGPAGYTMSCFSARSPALSRAAIQSLRPGQVAAQALTFTPMLVSAIDPDQEARLVGLDKTVIKGRYLSGNDAASIHNQPPPGPLLPAIASTKAYADESLRVRVNRLSAPEGTDIPRTLASSNAFNFVTHLPGVPVGHEYFPAERLYERALGNFGSPVTYRNFGIVEYWDTSPVRYVSLGHDRLQALPTHNPAAVWRNEHEGGFFPAPPGNQDTQFRRIRGHPNKYLNDIPVPASAFGGLKVVGRFDPSKLPGFDPLSRVPLESYYPPRVEGANSSSRRALGNEPLRPTLNLGGYVSQPPFVLTTIKAGRQLLNPRFFQGGDYHHPISVIRVRVSGVTGANDLSLERIRAVAEAIHERTGLAVDITAGSSPHPILVRLPPTTSGVPSLLVREGWNQKGVAVEFLHAVDKKSAALFGLVLLICSFFLANGAFANVRVRRGEIGTLMCLGWTRRDVFRVIIGELTLVGLIAGVCGAALASLLIVGLSLHLPLYRALLVIPVSVALAVVAGLVPARRAARGEALDAVVADVAESGRSRSARSLTALAMSNVRRVPHRTVLGSIGLAIGVAALTMLVALNHSFTKTLGGTLLGHFVSIQVRQVDFITIFLVLMLSALSIVDVLVLNLHERGAEFATLRTLGWNEGLISRVVALEGFFLGAAGVLLGSIVGTVGASMIHGTSLPALTVIVGISAGGGLVVTLVASLLGVAASSRLKAPGVLSEE